MPAQIFANDFIRESPTWVRSTTHLPVEPEGSGKGRLAAVRNALQAAHLAGQEDIVIFSDSHNLSGSLFGLLMNGRRARPTFIRTDPLFTPPWNRMMGPLRRTYIRAALKPVDRILVWAPAVIDRYERYFGLPRGKMIPLHFHHTLCGYHQGESAVGEYIFAGGDSARDYPTLLRAVEKIKMPVTIATHTAIDSSIAVPSHVTIKAVTPNEFRTLIAGAYMVIFPLRLDLIRTSGQQSYLNAMALGKAVIVTDTEDAPYYIDHGRDGLLTPWGDVPSLRNAIQELLDNPHRVRDLGEAAQMRALPMDQEYTWSQVLRLAKEAHRQRIDCYK